MQQGSAWLNATLRDVKNKSRPQSPESAERVAIPLDPELALRALLKVDPEAEPVGDGSKTPAHSDEAKRRPADSAY